MTSESGNDKDPQNKHPYRFYWLTAGLATIIAAIVAVSLTHRSTGSGSNPGPGVTAPKTTAAPGATGTGNSTPATATSGTAVYWRGHVSFSGDGFDFDSKPPAHDQTTIVYDGNTLYATASAQLAVWSQPGMPSASECQTWVATHPNNAVPVPAIGMQICIKTDQGRYGLLHIDSYSYNNSPNATVIVWGS